MKDIRSETVYELIDKEGIFKEEKIRVNAFLFNGVSKHPFGDRLEKYVKKYCLKMKDAEKVCDTCDYPIEEHGAICILKNSKEEIWSMLMTLCAQIFFAWSITKTSMALFSKLELALTYRSIRLKSWYTSTFQRLNLNTGHPAPVMLKKQKQKYLL